jgi:hypothetical protein
MKLAAARVDARAESSQSRGVKSLPVVGPAAAWLVGLRVRLPPDRLVAAGPEPLSSGAPDWTNDLDAGEDRRTLMPRREPHSS